MSTSTAFRFAVNVSPKPGILDPQGRAVEGSRPISA
jgi:phosphoribosylformylglycinamidine (FGAM) synthase PurS component